MLFAPPLSHRNKSLLARTLRMNQYRSVNMLQVKARKYTATNLMRDFIARCCGRCVRLCSYRAVCFNEGMISVGESYGQLSSHRSCKSLSYFRPTRNKLQRSHINKLLCSHSIIDRACDLHGQACFRCRGLCNGTNRMVIRCLDAGLGVCSAVWIIQCVSFSDIRRLSCCLRERCWTQSSLQRPFGAAEGSVN